LKEPQLCCFSGFVLARWTVLAAHAVADRDSAAVNTFAAPVTVDVFPGGGLEAAVAIRRRSTVNTVLFIGIMLVKPVKALGAARPEFG
jgi:hypothetical protein